MVSLPDAVRIEFVRLPPPGGISGSPAVFPEWRCDIPGPVLSGIQAGVLRTIHKGRACLEDPFDVCFICNCCSGCGREP